MRDASVEAKPSSFSLTRYNRLLVAVTGLVSAGLLYFGTGLHPTWWLLWLAPVPVLAIAPRLRAGGAFLLSSTAWFLGKMNQWNYLRHVITLPLHVIILLFVISAVVFGLGVLFVRSFLRRGSLFLAAFAFPVYWVTCEYQRDGIASQHMGQSRVHTDEFSAGDPDRFRHWPLGYQLRCVFVCQYGRDTVQRRRRTLATSCVGNRSRMRGLRGTCIWRMAVAVQSFS